MKTDYSYCEKTPTWKSQIQYLKTKEKNIKIHPCDWEIELKEK